MQRKLKLFNTMTKQKESFDSLEANYVSLYCCGPTVYNYAHIGNLRTYVFEDILRRTLEFLGYRVKHVINITDVGHLTSDGDEGEDKVVKAARQRGLSVEDIGNFFTLAFWSDFQKLNIKPAHLYPKATDYITQMIVFIQTLQERGFVYEAGGNVYFDTQKDPNYGFMRGYKEVSDTHTRIKKDPHKRSSSDFILWFTKSKFENQEMLWDSPWGKGYPGWHLECSTISRDVFGSTFDIHCGGIDHIAIHHTNEMAQNHACCGSFGARYWVHGEFLLLDKTHKMSKSSGQFLTLSQLEEDSFSALDYRYFLLQAHYRKPLIFSYQALHASQQALARLRSKYRAMLQEKPIYTSKAEAWIDKAFTSLYDDLNTPEMLAVLWQSLKDKDLSLGEKLAIAIELEHVLALDILKDTEQEHNQVDMTEEDLQKIHDQILKRNEARSEGNFVKADAIRKELLDEGIALHDDISGTRWHYIKR